MSWRERSAAILKNEAGGEPAKPSKPPVQAHQEPEGLVLQVLMVPSRAHFRDSCAFSAQTELAALIDDYAPLPGPLVVYLKRLET